MSTDGPRQLFSAEEDALLMRLKSQGLSYPEIEKKMPGRSRGSLNQRYHLLVRGGTAPPRRLVPRVAISGADIEAAQRRSYRISSESLVRRQLATGQYSGPAREAWLRRHGGVS